MPRERVPPSDVQAELDDFDAQLKPDDEADTQPPRDESRRAGLVEALPTRSGPCSGRV